MEALAIILASCGTGGAAAVAWCMKKHSKFEKVNVRCNYDDSGCRCGIIHEDTELEQRLKESKEMLQREHEEAVLHRKEIYEKDVELLDKDHQLKLVELELEVRKKDDQIAALNQMVESIRDDYVRFRDGMSQHVFRSIQDATLDLPAMEQRVLRPPSRMHMNDIASARAANVFNDDDVPLFAPNVARTRSDSPPTNPGHRRRRH